MLIVALHSPGSGGGRVLDAVIGGAVALFMSQILFPPSPISVLTGASRRALDSIAEELRAIARALADGDAAAAEATLERLREDQGSLLSDLTATRKTAGQIARRTLRGRREAARLARLDARLDRLDLLFGDALFLARTACRLLEEQSEAPEWLHRAVDMLAGAVEEIAGDPESPDAARRARHSALEASQKAAEMSKTVAPKAGLPLALAAQGICLVASDILRAIGEKEPGPARD